MKSKYFYISLNFIVPGMGQFSAKRYFRGIFFTFGAIASIFWMIGLVILPYVNFVKGDVMQDKLPQIDFFGLIYPVLLFIGMLAWSIFDMFVGFDDKKLKNMHKQEDKNA